jgi:hypothetical protein
VIFDIRGNNSTETHEAGRGPLCMFQLIAQDEMSVFVIFLGRSILCLLGFGYIYLAKNPLKILHPILEHISFFLLEETFKFHSTFGAVT